MNEKIYSEEKIIKKVINLKKRKKKIGFTNGCFDLLHEGHLKLLTESKQYCDFLIVALNSDTSIKKLKGDERPIDFEKIRVSNLSRINEVDAIIVFSEKTPIKLIVNILPDVIIKGGDYKKDEIAGGDIVIQNGGQIELISLLKGFSTTNIIKNNPQNIEK